jgi:glycosyltransferase involved in cell wall biosynthesis
MILMICSCFPPEPIVAATLAYDVASALSVHCKVRVLTPNPSRPFGFKYNQTLSYDNLFEHEILPSYTCSRYNLWGRLRESYSFGKFASKYIRKYRNKIQFIYVCTWPVLAPFQILRTAKRYSIPSILHVEDIYPEAMATKYPVLGYLFKLFFLPLDALSLKMASKIVAVSENMKQSFIYTRGIPFGKIEIIHNWQDENEFISFHELNQLNKLNYGTQEPFTIMYLGNIGPLAGIDFIIKCFDQAELTNARLIIAGTGAKKAKCYEQASRCRNSVIQFWEAPPGRVPDIQSRADVMILPVKRNGAMSSMPSKLPAYMFSKKPVIACVDINSDTAAAVAKSGCGWVVPPENTDELIATLKMVISVPKEILINLGENGFHFAMEHFSKKRNLQQMIHLIRETAPGILKSDVVSVKG